MTSSLFTQRLCNNEYELKFECSFARVTNITMNTVNTNECVTYEYCPVIANECSIDFTCFFRVYTGSVFDNKVLIVRYEIVLEVCVRRDVVRRGYYENAANGNQG